MLGASFSLNCRKYKLIFLVDVLIIFNFLSDLNRLSSLFAFAWGALMLSEPGAGESIGSNPSYLRLSHAYIVSADVDPQPFSRTLFKAFVDFVY